jgi:prolipoprotein diacylglyceryltransferase
MFGISVCLGWLAFDRYFKLHGIPVNMPVLGLILIGSGFAGAKVDDVLVNALFLHQSAGSFWSLLLNLRGGYTYLGCVVAGSLGGLIYARMNCIPVLAGFDSIFCMGLGYGTGRIGCFLAGDGDYGVPSHLPWAVSFPHGLVPTLVRVHPTMLYSSAWELAVFTVLWHVSNPHRQPALKPGTLFGSYLLASGAGRFLVEFLGLNPVFAFRLTEAQVVSCVMVAGGVVVLARIFLYASNGERSNPNPDLRMSSQVGIRPCARQQVWTKMNIDRPRSDDLAGSVKGTTGSVAIGLDRTCRR